MLKPVPLHPGAYYHIYNRGNNRENIFVEERNYEHFLRLYREYIGTVADTYAYCLLRNHFHLLVRIKDVESPDPPQDQTRRVSKTPRVSSSVSQYFSNFFNAYAKAINRAYNRTGSLFQKPFGRTEIMSDSQLMWVVGYIHRNPAKHGLVGDFRSWPYSSYRAFLSTQPTYLKRDEVLAWFDGGRGFEMLHEGKIAGDKVGAVVAEDD